GRFRLGKAPTPATLRRKAAWLPAAVSTAWQTLGTSRKSTSPRKSSVRCRFSSSTHLTSLACLARVSWSEASRARRPLPRSMATKVRSRAIPGLRSEGEHRAVLFQAAVDLLAVGLLEPVQAEALDGQAGDHSAIGHRAAQPARRRRVVGD